MDFCILKFVTVKLLIKFPPKIVLGAFIANGRWGQTPLSYETVLN